jgi:ribosomal protein S18 acetylase RimI-like enzyme
MSVKVRDLVLEDLDALTIVSKSVWEEDYAPLNFASWLEDPLWHPVGVFADNKLVSFAVLQEIEGTPFGWVKALRTNADDQRHGYGLMAVQKLVDIAKEKGFTEVRYVTSSRNEASQKLAEKLGFVLEDKVMSFRLKSPFPPRPKPSPSIVPLRVDAQRAFEAVQQFPDLMNTEKVPVPFEFEEKTLAGFERLSKKVDMFMIISEEGETLGLYYIRDFERSDSMRRRATVCFRERSTFVDTMSRIIEDTEKAEIENLGFFIGPDAVEWAEKMGIIPDDMKDRFLVLLTLKL